MSWDLVCQSTGQSGQGQETYDVKFCNLSTKLGSLFCSAGGRQLNIYRAVATKWTVALQCYVDDNVDECYYSCEWLLDSVTGDLLVAAAGLKGCIKIVNCNKKKIHQHLVGHGNSINDLVRSDQCCRVTAVATRGGLGVSITAVQSHSNGFVFRYLILLIWIYYFQPVRTSPFASGTFRMAMCWSVCTSLPTNIFPNLSLHW